MEKLDPGTAAALAREVAEALEDHAKIIKEADYKLDWKYRRTVDADLRAAAAKLKRLKREVSELPTPFGAARRQTSRFNRRTPMTWTTSPPREPGFYWVRWTNEDGTPQRYAFVEEGPFGSMPHGTEFGPRIPSAEALAAMDQLENSARQLVVRLGSMHLGATTELLRLHTKDAIRALDAARKETE